MPPTLTPQEFVQKWRKVEVKERSGYQEHFADLCRLVGHPTPIEDDPTGERFAYEAGVTKQQGGQGWADVWKKGFFGFEYKGKHANLTKAYDQLLQYRESMGNPPLLIVSDMERIVIHTNFTNTIKQVHELGLDDLLTPAGFKKLRDVFYDPEAFKVAVTTAQVTQEAAREFARLADHLRKWKHDPTETAHFLIRLLFCLFSEDVGLLPSGLFSRLVEQTKRNSAAFTKQLKILFGEMATGGWFGADAIPHFNGRLFDSDQVLELDSDALDILVKVSKLDWSSIEPAIFGTLFERSLDPAKRSQLGAHYTSKDDILLIVEPVLMVPLRRRWAEVQTEARDLATQRDQAATPNQRTKVATQIQELITGFAGEIAQVKVLDPACGSGNFLYVALKQLLDLEKTVITFAGDQGLTRPFPQVGPEQLRGIEINEYAHELAQITVWIGYIQWLRDNGFGRPSEPILKPLDTIKHMDSVLGIDGEGRPFVPDWSHADVIIGNPPFLGGKRLRAELGDEYVDALFALYDGRVPREADLVCYWFERSRQLIASQEVKWVGLISTNSIRGGANRQILQKIRDIGNIFMAWSDRPWVIDGAAVRVSIVGFGKEHREENMLDGSKVAYINSDLTTANDLTKSAQLKENEDICLRADEKGGPFEIPDHIAQNMINSPLNVNNQSNSNVIKKWLGARDIVQRPRNMWIIDFGTNTSLDEASLYEAPFQYVLDHVKPTRVNNRIERVRDQWWIHRIPGAEMRKRINVLSRYIATPVTSKYRIFTWVDSQVLPDITVAIFAREDDYFLGVLQSRLHEVWSLGSGGWMGAGNDPRYTPTSTFMTFPFPWQPGQEPTDDPRVQAIAEAARELVQKRDNWLNPAGATPEELKKRTLTNLYNERPTWLDNAHKKLDKAVFAAYDWPDTLSDEEILERLLALNLERAKDTRSTSSLAANEQDMDA
jgi:type II restriction/modification system DNA methylase subunit YeeA